MPENLTLIIFGACILLLFGLFYYYVQRQIRGLNAANASLTNHVLFQQKILEKHDQILTGGGVIAREGLSLPVEQMRGSLPIPPARGVDGTLGCVSMQETVAPSSNPVAAAAASLPLGPMVGSLLNMFNQISSPISEGSEEDEEEESTVSAEEIDEELSMELQELNEKKVPTGAVKKEGRIEKEVSAPEKPVSPPSETVSVAA